MPLSLNDIITFESELPGGRLAPEPAPERKVDELISRASRVLRDVNTILQDDDGAGQRPREAPAAEAPPAPASAPASASDAPAATQWSSDLSRAIFGGSAQVSEREGSRTRQALQRSLEAAAGPGPGSQAAARGAARGAASGAAGQPSVLVFGGGGGGGGGGDTAAAAAERPAWAQALFASSGSSSSAPSTAGAGGAAASGRGAPASSSPSSLSSSSASSRSSGPASPSRPSSAPSPSPSSPSVSSSPSPSATAAAGRGSSAGPAPAAPPPPSPALAPAPAAPALAPAPRRVLAEWAPLAFAEADLSVPTELRLKSEESLLAERALSAVLPPLQSVVDLTAAVRPPTRGLDLGSAAPAAAPAAVAAGVSEGVTVSEEAVLQDGALGKRLQDGAGRLADGTRFEKLSGTDTGPDGYVKKWEVLRGVTGDGTVQWEECWWQASNRYGLRELGAFKKGATEGGAAWVEEWKEVLYTHPTNLRLAIERSAHKWARDEAGDEWEEKWGEAYEEAGRVHKYADKWAKAGANVWHERWGEDYDGRGACQKWTDKWAERLLPGGGQEQWGDKWTETFGHGKGTKHGEVWSSGSDGSRYNRWWNEEHFGDGRVRKWGNSTSGEYWDTVEHMDTYYNPVPHFGFQHAVSHSPQLWSVPLPAPEEGDGEDDGLGMGLGRL